MTRSCLAVLLLGSFFLTTLSTTSAFSLSLSQPASKLKATTSLQLFGFGRSETKKDEHGVAITVEPTNALDNDSSSTESKRPSRTSTTTTNSYNMSPSQVVRKGLDTFQKSQLIGQKTKAAMDDLASTMVEGTAANGKVKIVLNGHLRPIAVDIRINTGGGSGSEGSSSPGAGKDTTASASSSTKAGVVVDFDLNDAVLQAMQEAHLKAAQATENRMARIYNELGLKHEGSGGSGRGWTDVMGDFGM